MGGELAVESGLGQGSRFHFDRRFSLQPDADDPPDQVLRLDWHMPGIGRLACAQALAAGPALRRPAPVVLMVTAGGRAELPQRLAEQRLQVDSLLTKPVTPSALLDACATALGQAPAVPPHRTQRKEALFDHQRALAGARLLLVEDKLINQELAQDLLSRAAVAVSAAVGVAGNGQEALDMLARERFDAVRMDRQIPAWTALPPPGPCAGSLGMQAAAALERACLAGAGAADVDALLAQVSQRLDQVISERRAPEGPLGRGPAPQPGATASR